MKLPEKHHRPVILAKITRKIITIGIITAITIPIIDSTPRSKSENNVDLVKFLQQ